MSKWLPYFEIEAFDAMTKAALGDAFDKVVMRLNGCGYSGALRQIVASRLIDLHSKTGESDPKRLAQAALQTFGVRD